MKTIQVYEGDGTQRREPMNPAGWASLKAGDHLYSNSGLFVVVIKTYVTTRSGYNTPGEKLIQAAYPHARRVTIHECEWADWSVVKPEHGYSIEDRMHGRPLTRESALKLKHGDTVYRRVFAGQPGRDVVKYTVRAVGVFMGSTKVIKPDHRLKWEFERKSGKRFWVWQEELFAYTTDKPQ